jgi:peptide/nickel transport system permease protein
VQGDPVVFLLFNGSATGVRAGREDRKTRSRSNIRRQLRGPAAWVQPDLHQAGADRDFGAAGTNEKVSQILGTGRPRPGVAGPLDTILGGAGTGRTRGSLTDRLVMIVCTVGLSISILVYIIVFQYVFAYKLGWFPVQGWGDSFVQNLFVYSLLPILIGLTVSIAPSLRLYRTFVLDEIYQDYVRTARAKGLSENRIMWLHVLRTTILMITNPWRRSRTPARPFRSSAADSARPRGDPRRRATDFPDQ